MSGSIVAEASPSRAGSVRALGGSSGAGRRREQRSEAAGFFVMAAGQIESGQFMGADNLFCRYTFAYGPDWKVMQGIDHGFSQVACKGMHAGDAGASIVWNFPVDVTFKSTNPHGWPRLVVSVYSQDMLGRYVVRGYGSVLIPCAPGRYTRVMRMFTPVASTWLQEVLGWVTGSAPEFYDSKFVASGEGREVTRVASTGSVRVTFNVLTRGMAQHGFATGGPADLGDLDLDGGGSSGAVAGLLRSTAASRSTAVGALAATAGRSGEAAGRAGSTSEVLAATRRLLASTTTSSGTSTLATTGLTTTTYSSTRREDAAAAPVTAGPAAADAPAAAAPAAGMRRSADALAALVDLPPPQYPSTVSSSAATSTAASEVPLPRRARRRQEDSSDTGAGGGGSSSTGGLPPIGAGRRDDALPARRAADVATAPSVATAAGEAEDDDMLPRRRSRSRARRTGGDDVTPTNAAAAEAKSTSPDGKRPL